MWCLYRFIFSDQSEKNTAETATVNKFYSFILHCDTVFPTFLCHFIECAIKNINKISTISSQFFNYPFVTLFSLLRSLEQNIPIWNYLTMIRHHPLLNFWHTLLRLLISCSRLRSENWAYVSFSVKFMLNVLQRLHPFIFWRMGLYEVGHQVMKNVWDLHRRGLRQNSRCEVQRPTSQIARNYSAWKNCAS